MATGSSSSASADKPRAQVAKQTTNDPAPATLANPANPEGKTDVSTGKVGADHVIEGQEHVLGDDPRRVKEQLEGGYHDSLTGAPVDENGEFTEESRKGTGPIPKHRIVANDWPNGREKIDDPAKREGNEAV